MKSVDPQLPPTGTAPSDQTGGGSSPVPTTPVITPLHWAQKGLNSPGGVAPQAICDAYHLDCADTDGKGQTIAFIEAYGSPTLQSDLEAFDREFEYPDVQVEVVQIGTPKDSSSCGNCALETSLDVQWAHAIAPGAKLLVVAAPSQSTGDLLNAVQKAVALGANEISISWGQGELGVLSPTPTPNPADELFNVPGISFFASSGDSPGTVLWPASSPYVVAVGGTSFTIGANEALLNEVAWSNSGGRISMFEPKPNYQDGFVAGLFKGTPDVAYDAAYMFPVYCSAPTCGGGGGWHVVGGTSAGAPQWAAIMAVANSNRGGRSPIQAAGAALYALSTSHPDVFHDITSGNNCRPGQNPCPSTSYAQVGYDLVTGLGSPVGNKLIPALVDLP